MMRARVFVCVLALSAWAHAASADSPRAIPLVEARSFGDGNGTTLAIPLLGHGETPEMVWAQRTIDRQWTSTSDPDHPQRIADWRSEPAAVALSAALPGAGQLYSGERSGYVFALAEAVGWVTLVVLKNDSEDLRDEAGNLAGTPTENSSGWSAERWASATGEDPAAIEALYAVDREAFYSAIGRDGRYGAGWSSATAQQQFVELRNRSDHKLRQSHGAGTLLWLNHLVAAADALRAARIHNLPLRRNLDLKATGGWRHHGPAVRLALVGRF